MSERQSLRAMWSDGAETHGLWLSAPSPITAETGARLDFAYVCIDMQHGAVAYDHAVPMIQAIEFAGGIPIARVPWNEPGIIGKMLDAGCHGVIVPMVNTRAEAEAVVRAARYAPDGSRSWGPTLVSPRHENYRAWADATIAVIPMIETREALSNLDDILSVPGIDAVYVGPADLGISLGLGPTGNDGNPIFDEALANIVDGCERHGVVPGIHASGALASRRRQQGFRLITIANDLLAMRASLHDEIRQAKESGSGDDSASLY